MAALAEEDGGGASGARRAGRAGAGFGRDRLAAALRRERDRVALWTPVAIALGVWAFFWMAEEPSTLAIGAAAAGALAAFAARWAARRAGSTRLAAVGIGLAGCGLAALGFAAAGWRAASVAAPVLTEAGTYQIAGRVIARSSSAAGRPRLSLDRVRIEGMAPAATPARVRVSFRAGPLPEVGARAAVRARLAPPPGPAEPGAFDFRRTAWFQSLGAVGAASAPARDLGPAAATSTLDAAWLWLARLRSRLAADARARVRAAGWSGDEGPVVAALLFGDRSGLAPETLAALRDANLAHLLAISGLHMGLVCLTVFGAARAALSLFAGLGLRLDTKKLAALAGLAAGAAYLALSGGALPTQRAFIMAAVAFGAVLVGRPAVTLRAVAVAATLILLLRPESLFDAGFQLSFAATTAMVAFFEASRGVWRMGALGRGGGGWRGALRGVGLWAGALVAASGTAGLATAPYAAAAFGRLSRYGLAANLAAVPAMGFWIMPAGLTALALTPFGLSDPAYAAMAAGVAYVLAVARTVAGWPDATAAVLAAPPSALGLLTLGGCALCLWRGLGLRALGALGVIAGLWMWRGAERPDLLIAPGGRLVGLIPGAAAPVSTTPPRTTGLGRALDRDGVARYAAGLWLRRDGDRAAPAAAAARPAFARFRGGWAARAPGGWRVELSLWRRIEDRDVARSCRGPTLLLAPRGRWTGAAPSAAPLDDATAPAGRFVDWFVDRRVDRRVDRFVGRRVGPQPCRLLDAEEFARLGAIAARFHPAEAGAPARIEIRTARRTSGQRYWSDRSVRARRP